MGWTYDIAPVVSREQNRVFKTYLFIGIFILVDPLAALPPPSSSTPHGEHEASTTSTQPGNLSLMNKL